MIIPAFEAAYEICPWVVCFKNAELLHVLMMLEVELDDGTPWPLARRGKNAIDMKNPPVTLVWNVSTQWADSDFIKCSEIERGLLRSGSPALSNRVAISRVMPALLTRSCIPLGSLLAISWARRSTSSFLLISPGILPIHR